MSRLNTELFIARRISGRGGEGRNVMVRIAAATVAVSTAVMIVAVAVILGFKNEISTRLAGFEGHVQVAGLDGGRSLETVPIDRDPALEDDIRAVPGFAGMNAYAVKGGIVKTALAMQGIMLKGVGGDYDWAFFREHLVEGELPSVGDSVRTKDILVSRRLSSLVGIEMGDRVEILFLQEGGQPRRDRFKVAGIYDSGLEELDLLVIPTDIRNVQRLNNWNYDQISGYEAYTDNFGRLGDFSAGVYQATLRAMERGGGSLMVTDITGRYPNLFDWLKAHDVNAAVILTIMLLVALLNMIGALLIIVLERTRMIGVLKSLGMDNRSLQRTFVMRSGFIVARGMLWGNAVGIALCLIQKYTHIVKLDQGGYFLSEVPIQLGVGWLLALNAATFALLLLLLTIPTGVISKIKPEKTLRYQ